MNATLQSPHGGLQSVLPAYQVDATPHAMMSAPPMAMQVFAMPDFDVATLKKRMKFIQDVKKAVMVKDVHFGVIPGCKKDSLLKPGAETLCQAFRLTPIIETRIVADDPTAEWSYEVERTNRDTGEVYMDEGTCIGLFEVEAICTLYSMTGAIVGRASARCSNRENKYRGLPMWDLRNTIEQMAGKRAHVSTTRTSLGCSDLFDMDIEDLQGVTGQGGGQAAGGAPVKVLTSNLTPKQLEAARKFGAQAGIQPAVTEFALLRVAKGEVKAFMDACFTKDNAKIAAAFEPYAAAWRAQAQAQPAAGGPVTETKPTEAAQGAGAPPPSDDPGFPDEPQGAPSTRGGGN